MVKKRVLISLAIISALLILYIIPSAIAVTLPAENAYLKVIEAPQRPKYNELPGFSEISLLISAGGIAAYYLSKIKKSNRNSLRPLDFRMLRNADSISDRKLSKKGVSPVIATVLLVALTIAMFLIIFTWSKGFIKEQVEKAGGPIAYVCPKISYDAVLPEGTSTVYLTNTGNAIIYGFRVKGENEGTSKIIFLRPNSGKLGAGEADNLDLSTIASLYKKITLIPVLLGTGVNSGTGKLFSCEEQAKIVKQ
jgi:flagellin-like protein